MRGKFVAFRDHRLVSDDMVDQLLFWAKRGLITEAASKLTLYPDRRYGPTDSSGLKLMKRTKKNEGRKLKKMFPGRKARKPRI